MEGTDAVQDLECLTKMCILSHNPKHYHQMQIVHGQKNRIYCWSDLVYSVTGEV